MVTWTQPDIIEELPELRRTSKELDVSLQSLFNAIEKGELVPLKKEDWEILENTDSNMIEDSDDVEDYIDKDHKDYDIIESAFLADDRIQAPIVLLTSGDRLYLVSGNTRLVVARVFKQYPQVWLADLREVEEAHL